MNGYFYNDTKETFSYIRVPKAFFTDDKYKTISSDAKFLYSILLDRMCLSQSNGWYDDDGRVYIIFTVKEIMDAMGCGDRKVKRLMDELEEKCDLIERKRRGQGKPSFIYVKTFESSEQRLQNRQNNDSRVVKSTIQESSEQRCNNTDINKTDYILINHSLPFLRKAEAKARGRNTGKLLKIILNMTFFRQEIPAVRTSLMKLSGLWLIRYVQKRNISESAEKISSAKSSKDSF